MVENRACSVRGLNGGSPLKGCLAMVQSAQAAAAWPNSAGVAPRTGMVRTRKPGTCARAPSGQSPVAWCTQAYC